MFIVRLPQCIGCAASLGAVKCNTSNVVSWRMRTTHKARIIEISLDRVRQIWRASELSGRGISGAILSREIRWKLAGTGAG